MELCPGRLSSTLQFPAPGARTCAPAHSELLVRDLWGASSRISVGELGQYGLAFSWTEMPQGSGALLTVHNLRS